MKIVGTLGKRIGLGFFTMVLILAVSVFIEQYQVNKISKISERTKELRTPTAETSLQMLNGINRSLAALRGWMLLGDDKFKRERQLAWDEEIRPSLEAMEDLYRNWTNPDNVTRLNDIQRNLKQFRVYQEEIEAIAQSRNNTPATKILFEEAAPQAEVMADNITQMIEREKQLVTVTGTGTGTGTIKTSRVLLLAHMADFRGSLGLGLANIRAYILSGESISKLKFQGNWATNELAFEELLANEPQLDQQQRRAFKTIITARTAFESLPSKIFYFRDSDQWNIASYELATKAAPLASEIQELLRDMHQNQKQLRDDDFEKMVSQIDFLDAVNWVLLALGIVFSSLLSWVITRTTVEPVQNALKVANEVAEGNLNIDISIQGPNETKGLGNALQRMVAQIKQRGEALNLSEKKSRGIIDGSIDTIITINESGIVQSFNLAGEKLFGYSAEEVVGQNIKILMPNPYHDQHDGYLKNYHDTGEKKIIGTGREVQAKKKDGTIFSMDLSISEVHLEGQKIYSGIIRDITGRKESEKSLRDSQAKIQAIVDNTVDGLITIDDKGKIETFNKACETIFGYATDEVIGQNVKMLMPEPYHGEHDGYLRNYHETGKKKIIGLGREVQGKRKDSSTFPLDLSVSAVEVEGRKLYSGIVRDITERKQAEESLLQANNELEEFAYRTSHDLRSPIVSSVKLLNIAQKAINDKKTETAITSLSHAQNSLKKLEELIGSILSLTEAKNAEEEVKAIDISVLLNDSLKKMEHLEGFENLNIQADLQFKGYLHTKESRLSMILENLISNAIKYQDPKKENSYIKISTHNSNSSFVLEVKDNGLGIPKDKQAKLFTMFSRFHPKTSFGSGLGLYLIKKSADVLNGKISYEGQDEGSIFKLVIPLTEQAQQ